MDEGHRRHVRTGVVRKIFGEGRASFEWRIPNYSELPLRCLYHSPPVECFDREWLLVIAMTEDGIHYACLAKRRMTPDIPEPVCYSIQCKTSYGLEIGRTQTKKILPRSLRVDNVDINPPWRIPPSAGVTLTCSLWAGEIPDSSGISRATQTEDASIKDFSILSKDFKTLMLPGTGHDVLLKVGGEQFWAHKCVLQARSPVFEAMFRHQMAESAGGSVTIEDCGPDAFGQFLQYLYSGEVDITCVDSALGVYHTGDKYDIPRLKEISVAFLKISFAATNVFDVFSLAARHGEEELLQLALVYFADHLEEVLVTEEWQRYHVANPTQANEMYLKAAQYLRTSLQADPDNRKRPRTVN